MIDLRQSLRQEHANRLRQEAFTDWLDKNVGTYYGPIPELILLLFNLWTELARGETHQV